MSRVAVDFEWQAVGAIALSHGLQFPPLPEAPGLYRFTFESPAGPIHVYIGETGNLRRRGQNYRSPGPAQATNLRMHRQLREALGRGDSVGLALVTTAIISVGSSEGRPLDLSRKTGRLIVENAAMAEIVVAHEADPTRGPILVNRPGVGEAEWA